MKSLTLALALLGLVLGHSASAMPSEPSTAADMMGEQLDELELIEEEELGPDGKPKAKVMIIVESFDQVDPSMVGEKEYEILSNMVAEDEQ